MKAEKLILSSPDLSKIWQPPDVITVSNAAGPDQTEKPCSDVFVLHLAALDDGGLCNCPWEV
jgi:hypothetical protein